MLKPKPTRVIGVGASSGASADDIIKAAAKLEAALKVKAATLATVSEAPFLEQVSEAAHNTGRFVELMPVADLKPRAADCLTISKRSLVAYGVPSISEAAALAVCGDSSKLLGPRLKCGLVTVAMAEVKGGRAK